MQRETGPGNRAFRFNVDLFFPAGQLQRFHVAVCKVLRDVVSLALGKIEIGEVASLPSRGTDVAHAIVERVPVLDPINLNDCVTFFDGDRELVASYLVSCLFPQL